MLSFGAAGGLAASSFTTAIAADYNDATSTADIAFSNNFQVVAVQVGSDTVVFNDNGHSHAFDANHDQAVILVGRTLADIGPTHILV
jgi:hypothetical protein